MAKQEISDKPNKTVRAKTTIKKTNIIIYIFVVALVMYVAILIVDQNVKIRNARETLSELKTKISIQNMDYVNSGEVVYINIAGN